MAGLLIVATIAYIAGVKLFYWPLLMAVFALYLPEVKLFNSAAGRVLYAVLAYFSITQLLFLVQFLLPFKTGFSVTVVVCTLFALALMVRREKPVTWTSWLGAEDKRALVAAVVFIAAFLPIVIGSNSIYRIAQIGSGQAIDGTNHFGIIAETLHLQDLDYKVGLYYPKAFHQSVGLVESTVVEHQSDFGWRATAVIYFSQYVIFGLLLIHSASYLISAIKTRLKLKEERGRWVEAGYSIVFGIGMALFVVLPFVQHGFLNYFYICGAALVAMAILLSADAKSRFLSLVVAQLLFFGSGSAWPLLVPPFIVITVLSIVDLYGAKDLFKKKFIIEKIGLLGLLLLQLVPIAVQIYYSGSSSADQGLNLTGDLRFFHLGTLILALIGTAWLTFTSMFKTEDRRKVLLAVMPVIGFVITLVGYQFFTTGEVRYYAIKVHFLVELFAICLTIVVAQFTINTLKVQDGIMKLFAVMIPFFILFAAYSVNTNPFYDLRNLFRTAASQEKPAYFDSDISVYTKLASKGDIDKFNSTLIHYNAEKKIFFAHMQLPYWMNMNGYDGTDGTGCSGKLYSILNFSEASPKQQDDFKKKLHECIDDAKRDNKTYYIVTDKGSYEYVHSEFGGKSVSIVTE